LKTFGTFMPVPIALAFDRPALRGIRFVSWSDWCGFTWSLAAPCPTGAVVSSDLIIAAHGARSARANAVVDRALSDRDLTMTIERMTLVWEERRGEALQQALGSVRRGLVTSP
jgi:hypothetical protein